MADKSCAINVVDVYDLAADIGKQFEWLIDVHGPESVTNLMPKVITVLEHLETLANRNQKENAEISDLKLAVERLESEKYAKAEERVKYEKELEQIEESWRNESKELVDMVSRLQEENRKLSTTLRQKEGDEAKRQEPTMSDEDAAVMEKLKETVERQRDQVRAMKREVSQKTVDLEALQAQLERMAKLNADYRRKTSLTQHRSQNLIQEKSDLEAQLHEKEHQIMEMKDHIRELESSPNTSVSDEDAPNHHNEVDLQGKLIIDPKDPNRPRYTMSELREVLQERNELKTRLFEVEEELEMYKPKEKSLDFDPDAPVHGPINKEPDYKLHPEKYESGIRKFFRKLFGSKGRRSGSSSPHSNSPRSSPVSSYQPPSHVTSRSRSYNPQQGVKQFFHPHPEVAQDAISVGKYTEIKEDQKVSETSKQPAAVNKEEQAAVVNTVEQPESPQLV